MFVVGVHCTSPEQECSLLQPDVGVDTEDKITTCTSEQATAHEEFCDPIEEAAAAKDDSMGKDHTKQFDPRG